MQVKRAEAVTSLRRRYLQLCKDRFGWRLPPKESFNRWLMERLLGCSKHTAEERDPLLPLLWEPAVSPSMSHEVGGRRWSSRRSEAACTLPPPLQC